MPTLMRVLTWIIRGTVFLFILLFAMKNTDPVTLRFYLGQSWTAPLALVLFLTLAFGALLGLVAGLERVMGQRREILALKRELRVRQGDHARKPEAPAGGAELSRPLPDVPHPGHP
jgi:uncharacterized integral membrane protein